MTKTVRKILTGVCVAPVAFGLLVAQEMPKTTKEKIAGAGTATTKTLKGTVVTVDGNHLAVRMSTGELRTFDVPDSRTFNIDGNQLKVGDLKPGTSLTATVTTTTTPVTERTTTVGTGKVWYVAGNTVILTLPNNENRMYKVKEDYKFNVNGQKASVHDLRKGMVVSAEKITEEPKTEIATNTEVTGHAPAAPAPVVAETPAPAPRPKPAPAPVAAPAPAPAPAPEPVAAAPPPKLPKTGSPLPLAGLAGLLFTGSSLLLRKMRRG